MRIKNMNVSIRDIAEKAGVHPSTVSLALRGSSRIPEATRERIAAIAEEIGYRPNYIAKALAGHKTQLIGIVVPKLHDSYIIDVITAQENWLQNAGYGSLLTVTHVRPQMEMKAVDDLIGRGVDGIAFNYIPKDLEVMRYLDEQSRKGVRFAMFGESELSKVVHVSWEGEECGYVITKYLLSLGHKRIAHIAIDSDDFRVEGYLRALREAGIPIDPQLCCTMDYGFQDVSDLRKELMSLKDRPTAIFAYNDDLAAELMAELCDSGYDIPGDVSIVGVNDGWYSSKLRVPLTTFRLPAAQMGIELVKLLVADPADQKLPLKKFRGELIIRKSTGPAAL